MISLFQLVCVVVVLLNLGASTAQIVPAVYVFGDSTVDAGNNNYLATILKANFPPYGRDFQNRVPTGRFSNGRIPTDFLSELLGLPFGPAYLDPQAESSSAYLKGVNFATSGSGFYEQTATNFNIPGLRGQVEWFREYKEKVIQRVGYQNASSIISRALFALSTGSNDYVNNYFLNPLVQKQYDGDGFRAMLIENFEDFVKSLYDLGARRIAAVSLSPLGCVPSQITLHGNLGALQCVDYENQAALQFNEAFKSSIYSLRSRFPDLKLAYIDVYSVFESVFNDPEKNGFEITNTGCCGIGRLAVAILCNPYTKGTCTDASKYVFWDSFHPTDKMNKVIAQAALSQGLPQLL